MIIPPETPEMYRWLTTVSRDELAHIKHTAPSPLVPTYCAQDWAGIWETYPEREPGTRFVAPSRKHGAAMGPFGCSEAQIIEYLEGMTSVEAVDTLSAMLHID